MDFFKKSQVLYSYYKRSIPNLFSVMLFNHHKEMKELEYQSGHSELFYFLPSITDGSEEVNQHFNKIRVSPNTWDRMILVSGWSQDKRLSHIFLICGEKKTVKRQCIVNTLKHFVLVSNANLIRNSDALLTRKKKDIEVNWVRKMKPRVPSEKF